MTPVKGVVLTFKTGYGDNVQGAENQQERLIDVGWVVGFVDGEGCFSISLVRQAGGAGRVGYRLGWQVGHTFAVVQGAGSKSVLDELQHFFGVGGVCVNRRRDNHKEALYRYLVNRREHLVKVIIPFFAANPLRTRKRSDFEKFAYCISMMQRGEHLTRSGLLEIVQVVETMNHRKPRPELIRILRGHTPDIPTRDDEMVQAAWRHADPELGRSGYQ